MENEEKKCCMNGDCEKCKGKKMGMCCGHSGCGGKCHMIRKIVYIVIIIIAFCLGTQWGEIKSEREGGRFERGGMMNWGYNQFQTNQQKGVGSVTVDVSNPATTTPAVAQ